MRKLRLGGSNHQRVLGLRIVSTLENNARRSNHHAVKPDDGADGGGGRGGTRKRQWCPGNPFVNLLCGVLHGCLSSSSLSRFLCHLGYPFPLSQGPSGNILYKTTADIPNGKKLDAFPLRSETKWGCLLSLFWSNIILNVARLGEGRYI